MRSSQATTAAEKSRSACVTVRFWALAWPTNRAAITCADEDDLCLHVLLLAALARLQRQLHAGVPDLALHHLGAELELQTLLRQRALEHLPQLAVLQAAAQSSVVTEGNSLGASRPSRSS